MGLLGGLRERKRGFPSLEKDRLGGEGRFLRITCCVVILGVSDRQLSSVR